MDVLLLPELLPSKNTAKKFDYQKSHWASCSVDLSDLPNTTCIHTICSALPKSILRVKGCTKIKGDSNYTYFERTPNGKVFIRLFNGIPVTGSKLVSIGLGSKPSVLENVIKESITSALLK